VNIAARAILFVVAIVAGIVAAKTFHGDPGDNPLFPLGHPQMQDWFMWIAGLWLLAFCVYRAFRGGAGLDLRWSMCLILGATMIYTEWFDVAPLKEAACQMLHARHHTAPLPTPCYRRANADGG
jgi:hypothetical protein